MRLAWTASALHDLRAVRAFIGRDNPAAANTQVTRSFAAVSALLSFPDTGRPGRRPGTREPVVARTPYIVAYRVRADAVELLRVMHGRQRWPDMAR